MPISTQEKFPRTENFPKMSLLKVEIFQLQNFFPTENLCQPIKSYKIFFPRKIFCPWKCAFIHRETLGGMGPLVRRPDSAIHRIVIFSTFEKMLEKL
jgi:hypothetical protein